MRISRTYEPVVHGLTDAAGGADAYGLALNLQHNTGPMLHDALETLVGKAAGPNNNPPPVPGLMTLWGNAKAHKTAKTAALRSKCSDGRALAKAVINSLKPVLGDTWNSKWNEAGFIHPSLAIPDNPSTLLLGCRAYYGANPTREVSNMNGVELTAAACQAAADAIAKADTESKESNTAAGEAQKNLQAGIARGHKLLSGLQAELGQLIAKDDPRWLAFGFDEPGHTGTPEVPKNLTATPGMANSHSVFAHCDDSRRADSYRFTLYNAADDSEVASQLLHEPQATFENLTAGMNLKVVVSAFNSTGESQKSAPVTVTVP